MKFLLLIFGIAFIANFPTTLAENADKAQRFKRTPMIGGYEDSRHEFTYAVAILSSRGEVCSGGIIGDRHVLTAAHCFLEENQRRFTQFNYTVIAKTNNYKVDRNAIRIKVKEVIIPISHGDWPDIAVVKLAEYLNLKKNKLKQLALAAKSGNIRVNVTGKVAGFGACQVKVSHNGTREIIKSMTFDGKLRCADVEVVDKATCTGALYKYHQYHEYEFSAKMIKTTTDVFGFCQGDSGSTFVHQGNTAIGVLVGTYDRKCDGRKLASLFISVQSHLSFIKNAVKGKIKDNMWKKSF